MRWLINNKDVWHPDAKYRIEWHKKAPSKGAQAVKDFVKTYCSSYVWYEEYRLPRCLLRVDFLCPTKKIAIEFNGQQHANFSKFFHGHRLNWAESIKRDLKKQSILEENGYTFIEITDEDLPLTKKFFLEKYDVVI